MSTTGHKRAELEAFHSANTSETGGLTRVLWVSSAEEMEKHVYVVEVCCIGFIFVFLGVFFFFHPHEKCECVMVSVRPAGQVCLIGGKNFNAIFLDTINLINVKLCMKVVCSTH